MSLTFNTRVSAAAMVGRVSGRPSVSALRPGEWIGHHPDPSGHVFWNCPPRAHVGPLGYRGLRQVRIIRR